MKLHSARHLSCSLSKRRSARGKLVWRDAPSRWNINEMMIAHRLAARDCSLNKKDNYRFRESLEATNLTTVSRAEGYRTDYARQL